MAKVFSWKMSAYRCANHYVVPTSLAWTSQSRQTLNTLTMDVLLTFGNYRHNQVSTDRGTAWGCRTATRIPQWNTTVYWKIICKLSVLLLELFLKLEGLKVRVILTKILPYTGAVIPKLCIVQTEKQASWGSDKPPKWSCWCSFCFS